MNFFISFEHNYSFDEFQNSNFEKYKNKDKDKALFYGLDWILDDKLESQKQKNKNIKTKIFINHSIPCDLFLKDFKDILKRQEYFEVIYSSCPYTSEFLNNKLDTTKYKFAPIPTFSQDPFNKYHHLNINKTYDVVYCGGVYSKDHIKMLKTIKNFKNLVISHQKRKYLKWPFFLNYKHSLTNIQKWNYYYDSKILIGSNLLYLKDWELDNFKKIPGIKKFAGYDYVISNKILPQMKTRMIEAASTKTLMLMKRDPWNVIEEWFEPNKHFIYWDNYDDLADKINEISKNFINYTKIIENASVRVKKYYFDNFIDQI